MAIQAFGKFDFDFEVQIMELQSQYTAITLQEIYDTIHDAMADIRNLSQPKIAAASGQDSIGLGLATGLTVRLINGWRVKAADRIGPTVVKINVDGGNLITEDANGPDPNDPLAPAAYVSYSLSKAVSAVETTSAIIASLDTRIPQQLVNGRLDSSMGAVAGAALSAEKLQLSTDLMTKGTVDTTVFMSTVTEFEVFDITDSVADVYRHRLLYFTQEAGGLYRSVTEIQAYSLVNGRGHFTVDAMLYPPTHGDVFLFV